MAKTRTIRIEGTEDEPDETAAQEAADFAEANEDEGGELFRVTDELRGTVNVKLQIVRTYPNTPDMAGHVGDLTPSEFSPERVRELYGPGRYRVRIVGPKGYLKGGGPLHIAKTGADTAAPPSGGAGSVGEFARLLQTMQEREEARARENKERRDKWIELAIPGLLTIIAGLLGKNQGPDMTALITALKPAPGPSITDLTTSLASLKTLTETPKDDSKLDLIFKVLELAKEKSGDGGGESNWIDVIRDLLKEGPAMVKPLLESMQAQQQSVMPSMQVTPVANRANPAINANVPNADGISSPPGSAPDAAPSSATGETDMLALFMPMIRGQLAKLFQWASEKRRVELYAEVLLEELPATVHQYVTPQDALKYLQHEQWFEIITAPNMEPRLALHREWLDAMRREVIDIIQEQLKQPTTTEDTTENA